MKTNVNEKTKLGLLVKPTERFSLSLGITGVSLALAGGAPASASMAMEHRIVCLDYAQKNNRWDGDGSVRVERAPDPNGIHAAESDDRAVEFRTKKPVVRARAANAIKFSAPVRGAVETELDSLKERLLQPLMEKANDRDAEAALRLAGTEAAAIAWTTPFPLLFLPALLEEKVDRTKRYLALQKAILQGGMCRAMAA
jgi:hypothetical protein